LPAQLFRRAEAFRSKILFSFSPGLVHSIVVEEPGRTSALTQGDMGWELASIDPPGSPIQVRGSLVESIIQGLLRLVWFDALDPNVEADLRSISEQGLTRPWRVVRLLDARGGELAVLGQGSTNDGRTFVRRGREDGAEYFAIEALLFESLARPLEAVLPRNSMRE
jgi:hypothetical protein